MVQTIGQPFPPAPVQTPPLQMDDKGKLQNALVSPWIQWLAQLWDAVAGPAHTAAPANSAAKGYAGQLAYDQNYLYVYIGSKWTRIPLQNF
jgi:hypothetical protein